MIRIYDLPGIPKIEARIHLNANARCKGQDHQLFGLVQEFIDDVLGFVAEQRSIYEIYDDELESVGSEAFAVNQYLASYANDGCELTWWRDRGWDISDDQGKILLCFDRIKKFVECIEDGLAPKTKMEIEALAWSSPQRPAARRMSVQDQRRNQSFLALGAPKRRKSVDKLRLGK